VKTIEQNSSAPAINEIPPKALVWFYAARPKTLPAAVAPVVVGSALAFSDGLFAFLPAFLALLCACLIQIGTNYANDLFDFHKGADTEKRIGPVRATQAGWVSSSQMSWATFIAFGLAVLPGIYLVVIGGWVVLAIGIASIAAGIAYTGGPYPLGYHGLGELFVFLFFGLVAVTGSYYVQALTFSATALLLSIPVGLLACAILMVNNIRDIDTDKQAGKNTLAVRFGREGALRLFALTVISSWICLPVFVVCKLASIWILLPFVLLPGALRHIKAVYSSIEGEVLNELLAATAKLGVLFALLMSLGLLLAVLLPLNPL
jgi:1,4-dihydroxy-2-naphthoate octaprenyltransferase